MRILVTQCMLSDHNGIILDVQDRKFSGKFLDVWQLNNTLVKNSGIKEVSKEKLESALHWTKMKMQYRKICDMPLIQYLLGNSGH